MTITTPSTPTIIAEQAYVQAAADQTPLQTILENANAAYQLHRPPLLVVGYTTVTQVDRTWTCQIPIQPSADGIKYKLRHYLLPQTSSPDDNMTVKVEEWTSAGGWSTLQNDTAVAATDNTQLIYEHTETIDADALKLRITYDRDNSGEFWPQGLLVYPFPDAPTAGVKASGFAPFDDGMLSESGAALNVEHHNRPKRNAHALLADRWQCAMSFVQEDDSTHTLYDVADPALSADLWLRLAHGRCVLPGQSSPTLTVRVIASVDAGSTTDRIVVRQVGGGSASFDASGISVAPESGTLQVQLDAAGTLGARALLEALGKRTSGNSLWLHAVVAWYVPGA